MSDKSKLPIKREFSAGGCVYKKEDGKVVWLVGKHSGYHKWVLPKGMIEPGEKGIETAVRETEEEMGVVARVVGEKPIHKDEYWFVAELKKKTKGEDLGEKPQPIRRVAVYQEEPSFETTEGEKVRVFKTVTFYLMEYVSGDPKEHDWEMADAGWFSYGQAMENLVFEGERQALEIAKGMVEGA
jgi:8-oxo-dGTP pyrophosphatase MutT (NUDIX family)